MLDLVDRVDHLRLRVGEPDVVVEAAVRGDVDVLVDRCRDQEPAVVASCEDRCRPRPGRSGPARGTRSWAGPYAKREKTPWGLLLSEYFDFVECHVAATIAVDAHIASGLLAEPISHPRHPLTEALGALVDLGEIGAIL